MRDGATQWVNTYFFLVEFEHDISEFKNYKPVSMLSLKLQFILFVSLTVHLDICVKLNQLDALFIFSCFPPLYFFML
jgi:hypothetical protein